MMKNTFPWTGLVVSILLLAHLFPTPPPSQVSQNFNTLFAQGNANNANWQVRANYGTNNQAATCTLASLASDTTGALTGRACTAISNTTNKFSEVLFFLKVKSGAASTVATGHVDIYAGGTVDGGTTYTENFGGTDAGLTMTDPPNMRLIGACNVVANATTYYCGPFRVTPAFGGVLPASWFLFIQNSSGGTLDSTEGSHAKLYQGVYLGQ